MNPRNRPQCMDLDEVMSDSEYPDHDSAGEVELLDEGFDEIQTESSFGVELQSEDDWQEFNLPVEDY